MNYFILAGEASGDLHGGNLIKAMKQQDTDAKILGWGGEYMQLAGANVLKHYKELAFMGFIEVLQNLPAIYNNFKLCKQQITEAQPDVVVLIDYPGFNLRMAKWLHYKGYKIVYYVAPQVWAWKSGRVHELNKYCDQILVILPFEKEFYAKYKIPVTYVGHPLLEHMQTQYAANTKRETQTKTIALLPGSRKQEITKILPTMLEVAKRMPQHVFVIAQAPNTQDAWLQTAHAVPNCSVVKNNTYNTIAAADAALVASGTATLETALIGTPQIVVYRANPISVWLARKWVGSRIRFISLVNLILDREAVPELIQERCSVDECFAQLTSLLNDSSKQLQDYNELKTLLGNGTTSTEAAKIVIATGNSGSN